MEDRIGGVRTPNTNLADFLRAAYSRKRVLITGHTGFKGAWLAQWLLLHGAEIVGFSLPEAVSSPDLYAQLGLSSCLDDRRGDVRDLASILGLLAETKPDFVFHLAAQPLVRRSYAQPVDTYATNVMGTVHLLEALRRMDAGKPVVGVMVTTDKCYENREWVHAYREEDPMGGHDPYSSSKGAAELAIASYRKSYFSPEAGVAIASARAGNVIGGGDWAIDRIIPDCVRSLQKSEKISVRNKSATRPWQHVLEPVGGYLKLGAVLAEGLVRRPAELSGSCGAFNFGPWLDSNRSVGAVVNEFLRSWPGEWEDCESPGAVHEAKMLNLATDKAFHLLDWKPAWNFERAVSETALWYLENFRGQAAERLTIGQIESYLRDATSEAGRKSERP